MRRLRMYVLALVLGALVRDPVSVIAAEVCGNGADDDGDDLLDEGCNLRCI